MNWNRDGNLPNPLEKLGMGLGFFGHYADSFWKATGMELDLVYADGEPWDSVARRIKGGYCRECALSPASSKLCQQCFQAACQASDVANHFNTVHCHAGQTFSVRSFGEIEGAVVLLLTGRVMETHRGEADAALGDGRPDWPQRKTPEGYHAALDLLELSLPYLRIRLDMDLLLVARKFPPLVRHACQYVDGFFRENINVAVVAEACGASEDYLSHCFTKHTGQPLSRYIAAVRTGHAMYLLREGRLAIAAIAFEVGFQSLSQFNRTFKALQKMTPSEFRRRERGE